MCPSVLRMFPDAASRMVHGLLDGLRMAFGWTCFSRLSLLCQDKNVWVEKLGYLPLHLQDVLAFSTKGEIFKVVLCMLLKLGLKAFFS